MSLWLMALIVFWLAFAIYDLIAVVRLAELPTTQPDGQPPDVTIVMAVRDDEAHVEASVQRLLAQRHVRARLAIVDDRSNDGTTAILARLAATDPRLAVRRVDTLPQGWLGKTHALQVATTDVSTRWILFTDGDAQLGSDTLARAIAFAERNDAHHVSLLPTHRGTTFLGRTCLLAFQLSVQHRVLAVNAKQQRGFVGTGAFNLVRTDAYRAIGGHEPLRLEVVDDVWLGCLLFRAGFRSRVLLAARDFAIDWGATPRALLRVVEKNMFAVLRYRAWLAGSLGLLAIGVIVATFALPWWLGPIGWVAVGACLATGLAGAVLARRMQWEVAAGLLVPLARVLLPIALLRSTFVTLRQGGVRWRGTFYPLAELRRGQVP